MTSTLDLGGCEWMGVVVDDGLANDGCVCAIGWVGDGWMVVCWRWMEIEGLALCVCDG